MAYCTQTDILEKLPEAELIALTDDDDLGVVDTARVTRAITDADAEIDGHCGKHAKVPLDPVPPLVRKFSVAIAIYNLFQRRHGAPEDRERDYKDAVRFLERVADGRATLGVQPPPDPPGEDDVSDSPLVNTRPQIFGTDTMEKY